MPDRRTRRGAHPKDEDCFAAGELPKLRRAVEDLSWLKSRGYSAKVAIELVGNRYTLRDRQRRALQRCAASDRERTARREKEVGAERLAGETVLVDGYNVLLTLEAALSGGVLLLARDGVMRDLAAMSAHYRRVQTTRPAIDLLAGFFAAHRCARVEWLLDRPVSNSARLKRLIEERVEEREPPWTVELIDQVDARLAAAEHVVASADSVVLDRCGRWINLVRRIVERDIPEAWVVDLS